MHMGSTNYMELLICLASEISDIHEKDGLAYAAHQCGWSVDTGMVDNPKLRSWMEEHPPETRNQVDPKPIYTAFRALAEAYAHGMRGERESSLLDELIDPTNDEFAGAIMSIAAAMRGGERIRRYDKEFVHELIECGHAPNEAILIASAEMEGAYDTGKDVAAYQTFCDELRYPDTLNVAPIKTREEVREILKKYPKAS